MTDETNTTLVDAATAKEGAVPAQPATPPATAAAPASQAQPALEQGQPQADAPKADDKPAGAPDAYEFTSPEGLTIDEDVFAKFSDVAKELDLPQDKAQLVLDKMAPALASRQASQLQAAREYWAKQSQADTEIGGAALTENLAHAKRAMDTFATPELKTLLNESGLGNHPEVVRFFVRTGKAIGEDRPVEGRQAATNKASPQGLYAASNMNP